MGEFWFGSKSWIIEERSLDSWDMDDVRFRSGSQSIEERCFDSICGKWTMFDLGFEIWIFDEWYMGSDLWIAIDSFDLNLLENSVQIHTCEWHMWFYLNPIRWVRTIPFCTASMFYKALLIHLVGTIFSTYTVFNNNSLSNTSMCCCKVKNQFDVF